MDENTFHQSHLNKIIPQALSLQESRDQLAFAIEAAALGTFDYNPITDSFSANDRLKEWFGLPPEAELDLKRAIDAIAEGDRQLVIAAIQHALKFESGGLYDIAYTIINPVTKKHIIVHAKGKTWFDEQKNAYRFTGTLENVTEERMAAAKAAQGEQIIRNIVLEAPMGICVLDAATLVSEIVNNSFLEVAGKPYEDIAGKFYWDSFAEARLHYEAALAKVISDGEPFYANEVELMLVRKGKAENVFVTFVYAPLKDVEGKVIKVVVWVLENTQQVIARQKIQQTTDKLNVVIEASGLGTFDLDLQTDGLICSERFHQIFGYTNGEQLTHNQFLSHLHPDDVAIRNEAYQKGIITGSFGYQSRIIDKYQAAKWIDVRGKVFYNVNGQPALLIGTCGDITPIKEQDQQKDFFIGAASHELKTPVTSIKGYVQLLQSLYATSGDSMLTTSLQVMDKQTDVLVKLIAELLDVSKIKLGKLSLDITRFNLAELLLETIGELSHVHPGYSISLVSEKNIEIRADRVRLGQVVVNLLNNAIKYGGDTNTVIVRTVVEKDTVKVSVQDNGIGISKKDQERIFERFFRAEGGKLNKYDGFGIGLFISADIIQRHGGSIAVSSEMGKGSNFHFTIPR